MKKWQCSVCGYIHTGEEPPEECPVCGADRSAFVEITETPDAVEPVHEKEVPVEALEGPPVEEGGAETVAGGFSRTEVYETVTAYMTEYHAHPISVHIPNGVLPLSVLFLFLSVLFGSRGLGNAAFYNMVAVFLAMPLVLFSGYNDWQRRYGGKLTPVFKGKITCGGIVLLLSFILVLWRIVTPGIMDPSSSYRWLFLFLHLILLGAAVVAGYLGGKLVFKKP
jgi:rubredoxin/uncharacterized membrane protein